ncbi:Uncharacterised protein [Enterobacter cloacae]|uniref:Uncharacterized protein n=1 Tax=Enterobacter cloacae TaxID=550 RepID=A0A377M1G8_ENTCL|nr:Uncharacterised protein [Enterobacter cloacae]
MKTLFSGRSDMPFAMLLLAPSLILLGGPCGLANDFQY